MSEEKVLEAVEKIHATEGDGESRQLEAQLLEQTNNGWQPGDPEDQPPEEEE